MNGLADLASVRAAAAEFTERYDRLDLLINNAGVMIPPYGRPVAVAAEPHAHDAEVQQRVWRESERLTGVTYSLDERSRG